MFYKIMQYAVETSRSTSQVTTSWDRRKTYFIVIHHYESPQHFLRNGNKYIRNKRLIFKVLPKESILEIALC